MAFFIVNEKCNGCLACVENCPANALDVKDEGSSRTLFHNMARCARCATCWRVCPQAAIEFQHLLKNDWDKIVTLNLIRCEICGEPVHTTSLKGTLPENLVPLADTLCPRHRTRQASSAHVSLLARKKAPGRGGKTG